MRSYLFLIQVVLCPWAVCQPDLPDPYPQSPVRWTVHKSCDTIVAKDGTKLRDHIVDSVATIKRRSLQAAAALKPPNNAPRNAEVVALAKIFLDNGQRDLNTAMANVADKFAKFSFLDDNPTKPGPGKPGDPPPKDTDWGGSKEWTLLAAMAPGLLHFRDIMIVCEPEVSKVESDGADPVPVEGVTGIDLPGGYNNILWLWHIGKAQDYEGYTFVQPKVETGPHIGKPAGTAGNVDNSLSRVPEQIFFRPGFPLEYSGPRLSSITAERIKDVTTTSWAERIALRIKRGIAKLKTAEAGSQVDALVGFTETLYHEFFHTTAFGDMVDRPNMQQAYHWRNNAKNKPDNNPELYMFLGTAIDLVLNPSLQVGGKQYTVSAKGELMPLGP